MKILSALQLKLEYGYKANIWIGATNNLLALEKYCQGLEESYNKGNFHAAQSLFEEAIELDTKFLLPYVPLAWCHMVDFWVGMSDSPTQSMKIALELVQKAVQINDLMAPAHALLGKIYYTMGQFEKGIEEGRRAVSLNPNDADSYSVLGVILASTGHPDEALYWSDKAFRLNPMPPGFYYLNLGFIYNVLGQYENAIKAYKKARDSNPNNPFVQIGLVESYSLLNRIEEARVVAQEVYNIIPTFSAEYHINAMAYRYQADRDRFLTALRQAGLK